MGRQDQLIDTSVALPKFVYALKYTDVSIKVYGTLCATLKYITKTSGFDAGRKFNQVIVATTMRPLLARKGIFGMDDVQKIRKYLHRVHVIEQKHSQFKFRMMLVHGSTQHN